ncbi:MAG: hypothetical protein ACFFE4_04005 [Candidatus Thorarchaeota archaeon]
MIRIEDINFNEDYYDILTRFLRKTTRIDQDYYQKSPLQKTIKSRIIRANCETLESYHHDIRAN